MRTRIFTVFPATVLLLCVLVGCASAAGDSAPETTAPQQTAAPIQQTTTPIPQFFVPTPTLTQEQARDIALQHAGFTADQVKWLRVEYEIDHGRGEYEVEFRQDRFEYSYEIDADTGAILSFEKDD